MHVHVIAIGFGFPSGASKPSVVEFVNAPADTQATGCAGFTFAVWSAARDPSLRTVIPDGVVRMQCICLWALAEACGTDTLASTGSCEWSPKPLRDIGG